MEDNQTDEGKVKLALATFNDYPSGYTYLGDTWSPTEIDKLESYDINKYEKVIGSCRFFYRKDPIASTVINKMVEIGITELMFDKGKLSDNEFRIFEGIKDNLAEFAEMMAMEYLITGLVIPEVGYARISTDDLPGFNVKKKETLYLPQKLWIRDPATVEIKVSWAINEPSYFVKVPKELILFIKNGGKFSGGMEDRELYNQLLTLYPDFVRQVQAGKTQIKLDNKLIIRRKPLSDSPYPTPYLFPALEALKHKRNLRRMDYSIASRVISAILLVKLGSDEFPVTEDDEEQFESIKNQLLWRGNYGKDIERIFELFANHTLKLEWVFPPTEALLTDKKYAEVNQDIFFSLGFPRILTTGETERSASSDPEFASISPMKSMVNMQNKLLLVLKDIVKEISKGNGLKDIPAVRFSPINIHSFRNFVEGMTKLYDSGNISRTSYADAFGYNWEEEVSQRETEQKIMEEMGVGEFAPQPFSPKPDNTGNNTPQNQPQTK